MSILIVDDIRKARKNLRAALEHPDLRTSLERLVSSSDVIEASSGEQALRLFRKHNPDLVMTDIAMPGMNGFQLTKKLLQIRKVPVDYHTGTHAEDALYIYVATKLVDAVPVDIIMKSYAFPPQTDEEYRRNIAKAARNAYRRLRRKIDLSALDVAIAELKKSQGQSPADYLTLVFREQKKLVDKHIPSLPKPYRGSAEAVEWSFKADTAGGLIHAIGYPVGELTAILDDVPQARPIMQILQKIITISDKWQEDNQRYSPNMHVCRRTQTRLEAEKREPMPAISVPSKKDYRRMMLDATRTYHFVIKAGKNPRDYRPALRKVLKPTGFAIGRSALKNEDSVIGLAGAFHSVPFIMNITGLAAATDKIRDIHSDHLENLCLFRGYEAPTEKDMDILVEPFYNTRYVGSILEHPLGGVFIIEFTEREEKGDKNYFLVYDANKKKIVAQRKLPVSAKQLALAAVDLYREKIDQLNLDPSICRQMEIGFDVPTEILDFQLRDFKPRHPRARFEVEEPDYSGYRVMGRTAKKGINLVVIRTQKPIELYIAGENARKDRLKVCYVADRETDLNIAAYIPNLGALILGNNFAVLGHENYNAIRNSQVTFMLTQRGLADFRYDHGKILNLVSDGSRARFSPLDARRDERFNYEVKKILNGV